jgi:hypothetical protein
MITELSSRKVLIRLTSQKLQYFFQMCVQSVFRSGCWVVHEKRVAGVDAVDAFCVSQEGTVNMK